MTFIQDHVFIAQDLSTDLVDHQPDKLNVNVYPNPTAEFIQVDFNTEETGDTDWGIEIIDLYGKTVMKQVFQGATEQHRMKLDVGQQIPSGTYVLRVSQGDKVGTRALVKL
jgi:hypothetical protein